MSKRANRFLSDAQLQSLVRYGPEISGLVELARQAKENYTTGVAQARGTAAGIIGAVDRATPAVSKVYDDAGLRQAGIAHVIGDDANLPGVPSSIRAAAGIEAGAASSRIGESRATSLTELADRRVQAKSGQQFATQAAHRELVSEMGKILRRRQDLAQEQGAFTASTLNSLLQQDLDRRTRLQIEQMGNTQSERNSLRSSGIDPNTGQPIPGGKLDPKSKNVPGKNGWQTEAAHAAAGDQIQLAAKWIHDLKRGNPALTREQIAQALSEGREARPIYQEVDDGKGGKKRVKVLNPDGTEKRTHAIPAIKSQLLLSAALDEALGGFISRTTQRRLHARGLLVKRLPLTSYQAGTRRARRVERQRKNRYGPNG